MYLKQNKRRIFQPFRDIADTHKHIDGALNHYDCLSFLPLVASIFTPILAVGPKTAKFPTRTSRITPITSSAPATQEVTRSPPVFSRSPALEQLSSHTGIDFAMQSPKIPPIDIQPFIP